MADEFVTLAGVKMDREGFVRARDLSPLLGQGQMRGENLLVETQAGRVERDRLQDEWYVLLQFLLFGDVDETGTAHSDKRIGIRDNLEYLRTQHLTGSAVNIVHTFSDSSTRTGTCTVEGIDVQAHDSPRIGKVLLLTYDLTVAGGFLES